MKIKKMWGGRFSDSSSSVTEKLSVSVHFDKKLYKHDIEGSIAHSQMLNKIGVLSNEELNQIVSGLEEVKTEIENGTFNFRNELEDIHMNIESRLTEIIGPVGKKLHTARSRNDQVALDTRLYVREQCDIIQTLLKEYISLLVKTAEENIEIILPGYTHLQVAQPVRLSHHILAHTWPLLRDLGRLENVKKACSISPLGAGALAGVNYPSDRQFVKEKLSFESVTPNSMDTVADRDYVFDFLYFASVLGTHHSRFCEELILWSNSQFNFIRLSDSVTTGSSIMPQKKNPDLAEIIRGKSGRLYGNLLSLLTIVKGLPLTYNRDLQEDKEPLFDSAETVILSLEGMIEMMKDIEFLDENMKKAVYSNYSTATDLADYLVMKNIPFREAHEISGNIVAYCEKNNVDFFNLKYSDLKQFSDLIDEDIENVLNPETSTERKLSEGGTSKAEIKKQISNIKGAVNV